MGVLLFKTFKFTFLAHLYLFVVFMIGFVLNKERYGDDYINQGVYFNILFLQFVPFTFCIIFVLLYCYDRFFKKRS